MKSMCSVDYKGLKMRDACMHTPRDDAWQQWLAWLSYLGRGWGRGCSRDKVYKCIEHIEYGLFVQKYNI